MIVEYNPSAGKAWFFRPSCDYAGRPSLWLNHWFTADEPEGCELTASFWIIPGTDEETTR